jgi:disulfide bond formation protein DsbB
MEEKTKQKDSREHLLYLAWIASVLSMFGSLYFSEIREFVPCTLCWYQRILMYPFVIILGLAVIRKDYNITFYTMILSGFGACISIYHYSNQKLASIFESSASCGPVPCTGEYINWLSFITIPFMALVGFIIIFTCSLIIWKKTKEMNE